MKTKLKLIAFEVKVICQVLFELLFQFHKETSQ